MIDRSIDLQVSVQVADLESEVAADAAVRDAGCCVEGELIADSEPPRRFSCSRGLCSSSISTNGFVALIIHQGRDREPPLEWQRMGIEAATEHLSALLAEAARPSPLEPVAETPPLVSCDAAPTGLAVAIGDALGSGAPARAVWADSGDGPWLRHLLERRRGSTICEWSADGVDRPVYVGVTPGGASLIEAADPAEPPSVGEEASDSYYFAINGAAVRVSGVDEVTARRIAEAHG